MTRPRLRSKVWFGGNDLNGFLHRAWLEAEGLTDDTFRGRISDARMSGTSYGTCVLHVAPESGIGGPLALVQVPAPSGLRARLRQARPRPRAPGPRGRRLRLPPRRPGQDLDADLPTSH